MSSTTSRSHTPSRAPSRSGTPLPRRSPAGFSSPSVVRSVSSASSLRIQSHGSSAAQSHTSGSPTNRPDGVESSSSSSLAEGILIQEPDAEVDLVDGEQGNASGIVESRAGNEESKKNLREQLRRTLNRKESLPGMLHCSRFINQKYST